MLPYRYTSDESLDDAAACAKALGIRYDKVSIEPAVAALRLGRSRICSRAREPDITEENLQSRVRGTILMAISNKFGAMVRDDRQQERNVGRLRHALRRHERRLQSDQGPLQDGGLSRCARWRNAQRAGGRAWARPAIVIPERIITKAPTAELRDNQTDQDSLPPYEVLDDILRCLVEQEMPLRDIIARGHAAETVKKVERLLYLAEYKRRQAAPGVKISARNFGRDRRYPITNKFREDLEPVAPATQTRHIVKPDADTGGDL